MLTLKGNHKFLKSEAYKIVRESAHMVVQVYKEGIDEGGF
jgi:hypothetical protein